MNYQSYDEYMRDLMGYPNMRTSMNQPMNMGMNTGMNMGMNTEMSQFMNTNTEDLERMYPETYRIIFPMVCFACDNLRSPVTEQTIDMMTDDIYDRVEADGRINIDISVEVRNDNDDSQENRQRMHIKSLSFFKSFFIKSSSNPNKSLKYAMSVFIFVPSNICVSIEFIIL